MSKHMANETAELSVILEYELDELQANAYRIAMMYIEKARKFFPTFRHHRMRGGDPRKSELWRHCYKLLRDRGDELKYEDAKLYIHAQFDILRHICLQNGQHPNLVPSIISSEQAWKRWLLWKKKYDKVKNFASSEKAQDIIDINKQNKVVRELDNTRAYFFVVHDRLQADDVRQDLKDGNLWLWTTWGKISNYYLILSPIVQQWLKDTNTDLLHKFSIDVNLYKPGITPDVEAYFKKEFVHEFN